MEKPDLKKDFDTVDWATSPASFIKWFDFSFVLGAVATLVVILLFSSKARATQESHAILAPAGVPNPFYDNRLLM